MRSVVRTVVVASMLVVAGCREKETVVPVPDADEPVDVVEVTPMIVHTELDADGNGLYDDTERLAMLQVLQQAAPAITGTFDADGDGRVTIAEQTAGRHPLTMEAQAMVTSEHRIPWAIDAFPEWLMAAYLQEDVALGAVAQHAPRGIKHKHIGEQADAALQPRKLSERGGIEFAADSGQHLVLPGHRDARWDFRWCIFTFRIDGESGGGETTVLLDLNKGKGSNKSSPKVWYTRDVGLSVQYVGRNAGGLDPRVMQTDAVVADGETWNVLVCGIRYGQMYASVNGVALATAEPQPPRFAGEWAHDATTYLGHTGEGGNMRWAYDALVFGQSEPSEAMVRKMTGWAAHRLTFQANLPADHPYREARPVIDAEDFPYRFVPDEEARLAWGAKTKDKTITRQNTGGERVETSGWERVFYDDFRADRIGSSMSGAADLWAGPGFNPAVGVDAPLVEPGRDPQAYFHDAEQQLQTLSLVPQGENNKRWRGSAFYSVNDLGHGYTWFGPKVFRIRCKFPKSTQKELAGGLFPAFWSYSPEFLVWRTGNRIECDWFEFDGQNGYWYNGLSSHLHYSHLRGNIFAKNPDSYKRFKIYSGELKEEKSKIPGGLFFWDGRFHTWEFVVDADWTYINVTIADENGQDRWVEVCRTPTSDTYLQRLDLQLDYALKGKHGSPTERQDFIVDFIEVLQKTEQIQALPTVYAGRPTISGEPTVGSTLRCEADVPGVTDLRYFWYADGYPLTWGADPTWTVTSEQAGTQIRCMVMAVGALDAPEAWTESVAIPAAQAD